MTPESAIIYAGRYYNRIAAIHTCAITEKLSVRLSIIFYLLLNIERFYSMIRIDENYIKDYDSILNYEEIVILFILKYLNLFYM